MAKTCTERIEDVEYIDLFRGIVNAIPATTGPMGGYWYADAAMDHLFPDPTHYAARIEGDPAGLARCAKDLGPNAGEDYGSVAALYARGMNGDLTSALKDLDRHWKGSAADAFVTEYMPELSKHLQALADACEKQKSAADKIEARIKKAHDDLVSAVRDMVSEVVGIATWGTAGEAGAAIVGGAAAAGAVGISVGTVGVGAAVISVGIIALILEALTKHHSTLQNVLDLLNTDLGVELTNALEAIQMEDLAVKVDASVSKESWQKGRP